MYEDQNFFIYTSKETTLKQSFLTIFHLRVHLHATEMRSHPGLILVPG